MTDADPRGADKPNADPSSPESRGADPVSAGQPSPDRQPSADQPSADADQTSADQTSADQMSADQTSADQTSAAAGGVPPLPPSARGLLDLLGGRRGMLDSAVPGAIFVAVYITVRNLSTPLWIAGGTAAAIFAFRVARREPLRHAASGLVGVAIAAGLAVLTGKPENYFLPALVINAVYAAGSAVSLAVRWPVLGLVLGPLLGEGTGWRADPGRRRTYTAATAMWMGMFLLRVAALLPLWLAGLLVPLGIARIVLGYPLYALVVWLTWVILRRPQTGPASAEPGAAELPS